MRNFKELEKFLIESESRTLVVAAAEEPSILDACRKAYDKGIVNLILIGDHEKISEAFKENEAAIIDIPDSVKAAERAVELLIEGKADAIMKGLVHSDKYLKAILSRKEELMESKFLSHVAVTEFSGRFLIFSDAAMNIAPELNEKVEILKNAVRVALDLGVEEPKTALVCPVEKVNPKMKCTIEAAAISKMSERGQLGNCGSVDGPLALDVALSENAAQTKKVKSHTGVAGHADILLLNGLTDGNVFYKSLEVFTDSPRAAILAGTKKAVVLTSRGDDTETKFNSIMLALAISSKDDK